MSFSSALDSLSKEAGDLFVVELSGREILFRLPSYRQATQYALLLNLAEDKAAYRWLIFDHIFKNCVEDKYLADFDENLPAGIPETIAKLVLFLSGVDKNSKDYTEELFSLYREQSESKAMYMQRFICSVFPAYTFNKVEKLNYQELVNVFIQAEKLLLDRGIIEREHDFLSEEEMKKQQGPQKTIGEMIRQDGSHYKRFDSPHEASPDQVVEHPAERAARQEAEFRRILMQKRRQK
jgi:hypothetical protein